LRFQFGSGRKPGGWPGLAGTPVPEISARPVSRLALVGADYPGLRPAFAVAEGEEVAAGQILFTDRADPRVGVVSPAAGVVESITQGPRRSLSELVIRVAEVPAPEVASVDTSSPAALRAALLAQGLWPAFRARPFGGIPSPDAVPQAILVIATDSEPWAADPRAVLAPLADAFRRGVACLTLLTEGPVHLCQPAGEPLAAASARVEVHDVGGPHPSGLAGARIRVLHLSGVPVWTIGAQDVAAIGQLAATGRADPERIVALCGPRAMHPRLLRTLPGAALRELTEGEETPGGAVRVLSGSPLSGRDAAWLARGHRQVTLIDEPARRTLPRWLARGTARPGARPILPTRALETALPRGFLPVPLMRALAVGDVETAARLGAGDLIEEDVALLSALCTSGADYGALLRHVLDDLAANA
jgi:Na+-transporting NADH:ubiquinone oxidoreductase subunit A